MEEHRDKWLKGKLRSWDPADTEDALEYTAKCVENAVLRNRIDQDKLAMVVKGGGKFKTQIELDADRKAGKNVRVTSGGMNNPEARKEASNELFGTNKRTTPPGDYEYYGYLWDDDFVADFEWDGPSQYGGSTIQFKSDVRDRTTFTCGDSLGGVYTPSYLDEVTPSWGRYATDELAEANRLGYKPSVESLLETGGRSYIEAQYHGGMTLDDVESFVIGPHDYRRNGIDKSLVKALNERGIKVGVVEYDARKGGNAFRWLTKEDLK